MSKSTIAENIEKKGLPNDLDAEMQIIGGLLIDSSKFFEIIKILDSEDFYYEKHKVLYKAMIKIFENGNTVEPEILKSELKKDGTFDEIGGSKTFVNLVEKIASTANIMHYAEIVHRKAAQRKTVTAAYRLIQNIYDNKHDEAILENHDFVENALESLKSAYVQDEPDKDIEEISDDMVQFPDVMSGLAGDFARIYSAHLESPPHFFYISFLACLGSVISNRITLASEIAQQPRLYVLLLGESADDRKSTAISKTVDFFRQIINPFHVCYGVGSAEGLQRKFEDIVKKNEYNDYFKETPRLLLCFDEFKQFVSKCKIESSVLLPCVNTLFESNRYESRTKTSHINLENVFLSLLAASTVQTYEKTWDASFTDIGFNNRLFLVPGRGERKFSIPEKISRIEIDLMKKGLAEILKHSRERNELNVTDSAKRIYHDWYMNQERSIHAKRLDVYALRFAILLSVNAMKDEIDDGIILKSIAIADWQLKVRQQYDPIDAETRLAKMEERIRRALSKPRKDYELKQKVHASRSGLWIYETAKKNLESAGEISWQKGDKRWKLKT